MELQNNKFVFIIDEDLPVGILANTAGIIGITLGKYIPEAVGDNVFDRDGNMHIGITKLPVPILKANRDKIKIIRSLLYHSEFSDLIVVDFSDIAQRCKTYDEFVEKMANTEESELAYFGIGIYGSKKLVNRLTGNLPLLK